MVRPPVSSSFLTPAQPSQLTVPGSARSRGALTVVQMNWLKNAFTNEEFETKVNPGLSKEAKKVTVTNPANGKNV